MEVPKRRIHSIENIFAIIFLLMVILYVHIRRVDKLTILPIYYKNTKNLDSYYKNNTSGYHILVVEFFIISMRRTSISIEKI